MSATGAKLTLSGVLLAGGQSRRMGRDKASLPFEGEPLAARCARLLAEACEQVVVASGDGTRLAWLGLPQVADAVSGRGPLGGLVAGLESAHHPLVAVLAADMPFASPSILRLLASLHDTEDAVVPVTERGIEPLHAVFARDAAPALRRALEAGTSAVHEALATLRVRRVEPEEWRAADPSGRFAANLNRPEDLSGVTVG